MDRGDPRMLQLGGNLRFFQEAVFNGRRAVMSNQQCFDGQ